LANWYDQEIPKHVRESYGEVRMIEDSPEGGLNIITMLQDFFGWVRNASPPEAAQMASKGMLIEYGWAFFGVGHSKMNLRSW
jgi:hypothetical protein